MKGKENIVFICHAKANSDFASALLNLLHGLKIPDKSIVCTCSSFNKLKNGRDWHEELKNKFVEYNPFVIIVHSSYLYKSPVSMNEIGAAWVTGSEIYSFLVNGFYPKDLAGVFPSTHQSTIVSNDDISGEIEDLYDRLINHLHINKIDENEWLSLKNKFIKTIKNLPVDSKINDDDFDINETVVIHTNETKNNDITIIKWSDLIKELHQVLSSPHNITDIDNLLRNKYNGISTKSINSIKTCLVEYGMIDIQNGQTDKSQCDTWSFTTKGLKAYKMACTLKIPYWQKERDKETMSLLMQNFSTTSMDNYLREGPDYVDNNLLVATDTWHYILTSSSYIIYQSELEKIVENFSSILFFQMSQGQLYASCSIYKYKLQRQHPTSLTKDALLCIKKLEKNIALLATAYKNLINYIHCSYPDFNLKVWTEKFEQSNTVI